MSIENLLITVNGKELVIDIDSEGLSICPLDDDEIMTLPEINYLSALAFLYVAAYLRGTIVTRESIAIRGFDLYRITQENVQYFKKIEDMTLEEFQEEMKAYDGRE